MTFLSVVFIGITGCSNSVDADFTYYPRQPKAGAEVTFTNTSASGSKWNWNFGDDDTSTSESPVHTYTKSGTYKVVLRVNSDYGSMKIRELVVYDTIPIIEKSVDEVGYYNYVTFSSSIYNPNDYDVTYKWTFSSNAHGDSVVDGTSVALKPIVYFSKKNVDEIIKLHVTIGDSVFDVADTITINDVKARSLLMAAKDGYILRQRIFDRGFEDYKTTNISSGKHPFNMSSYSNYAFIFDAGSTISYQSDWLTNTAGDGSIRAINLATDNVEAVTDNSGFSTHFGFFNGSVDANYIYWTDYSEFVYRIKNTNRDFNFDWYGYDNQTKKAYCLTRADKLGYYGNGLASNQFSGGISCFDDTYFWAKGGSGTGIYRFVASDVNSGSVPSLGAILTDYSIRAFTIDKINQKIYFSVTAPSDKIGFWVANINGSNPKRIDDAPMDNSSLYITGIVVDNTSNNVYWAYRCPDNLSSNTSCLENHPTYRTGVKQARLATLYTGVGEIQYFALGVSAYGLALDEVEKY